MALREEVQQIDGALAIGLRAQVIATALQEIEDMQNVSNRLAIDEVITRELQGGCPDGLREAALQPLAVDADDSIPFLAEKQAAAIELRLKHKGIVGQ